MLNWCNRFNIFVFLDNHQYYSKEHQYECLAGCGWHAGVQALSGNAFEQLDAFQQQQEDWLFGHLAYDLFQEINGLSSRHASDFGFPHLQFFVPQVVLLLSVDHLSIGSLYHSPELIWNEIQSVPAFNSIAFRSEAVEQLVDKEEYLSVVRKLQEHLQKGDCYEINYCIPFEANAVIADPVQLYERLSLYSPNPFSACYRSNDQVMICASPERFLMRQDDRLISQPMKGTIRRGQPGSTEDDNFRHQLATSEKDRSENVMVVDLVRNDLSRICQEGSVQTEELFGIYPFPQVFQMVSTISGQVKKETHFTDIIRALFPMGSMTGAPKHSVLQLIDRYEKISRGLFSGSVGYIRPGGDFDFNVVIRSLFLDQKANRIRFFAGSGITVLSDPEEEYDECLLKASAIRRLLEGE